MIEKPQELPVGTVIFANGCFYRILAQINKQGYFKIKSLESPDAVETNVYESYISSSDLIQRGISSD